MRTLAGVAGAGALAPSARAAIERAWRAFRARARIAVVDVEVAANMFNIREVLKCARTASSVVVPRPWTSSDGA